jgi:hypothetical protein
MQWWIRRCSHHRMHLLITAACALSAWLSLSLLTRHDLVYQSNIRKCTPPEGAQDVLVVMKTGSMVLHQRLPVYFETIFRCIPDYVVYSDMAEDFHGHPVHDILADIDASLREKTPGFDFYNLLQAHKQNLTGLPVFEGWKLDKWKFLPMISAAFKARPDAKWFVFIEDDTALIWSNLLRWLSEYDHTQKYFFGREERVSDRSFPYGGSGFVLSNAALRHAVEWMTPRMEEYFNLTRDHVHGDIALGWMLEDAGLRLTNASPLLQADRPSWTEYDENVWCRRVVTHHHMSSEETASLWELEQDMVRKDKVTHSLTR